MTDHEFQVHVVESLATLQTDMTSLIGNGQPGRIQRIESELHSAAKRIGKLEHTKSYLYGIMAAASGVVAIIVYILEARR